MAAYHPLTLLMLWVEEPYRRNAKRMQGDDGEWRIAKAPRGDLVLYLRRNGLPGRMKHARRIAALTTLLAAPLGGPDCRQSAG